jgi:hypothetical protein
MDAAVSPLPTELITPPVKKMNLVFDRFVFFIFF